MFWELCECASISRRRDEGEERGPLCKEWWRESISQRCGIGVLSAVQCCVHALSSHALYHRCIYPLCVPLLRGLSVFVVVVVVVVCPLLFCVVVVPV